MGIDKVGIDEVGRYPRSTATAPPQCLIIASFQLHVQKTVWERVHVRNNRSTEHGYLWCSVAWADAVQVMTVDRDCVALLVSGCIVELRANDTGITLSLPGWQ